MKTGDNGSAAHLGMFHGEYREHFFDPSFDLRVVRDFHLWGVGEFFYNTL